MNDDELASAVDRNYWESYTALAQACGGGVLRDEGVLAISTGLPVPALNQGFVTNPLSAPEDSIRELIDFFDHAGVPFILRVREGVDPDSEQAMAAMGMPYSDTVPGMAMFPIGNAPPLPAGLTIEAVRDDATLARFQQVMAEGFGMPLALAQQLMQPASLKIPGFESYLGLIDDEPVATSSVYTAGEVAGVYNVATIASRRRRGFGEALTGHAVSRGQEQGCTVAILQASAMGKPVYERMGFRTVAPYRTFHRNEGA